MNFETPKELLDFVLTKCGNMEYDCETTSRTITYKCTLKIYGKNIDTKRIYYACQLLKETFNIIITSLYFDNPVELEEDISKIDTIERLHIEYDDNIIKYPKLPENLTKLISPKYGTTIKMKVLNEYGDESVKDFTPCGFDLSEEEIRIWLYDEEDGHWCFYYLSGNDCLRIFDHSDFNDLYFLNKAQFDKYINIHKEFLNDNQINKLKKLNKALY